MPVDELELSAAEIVALPGVVVSGHVGRNVSRVQIGDQTCYLKREHRVRWRDRFRNWRDGFGFCSISEREAMVLAKLKEHGLPGPTMLASGESFLLLAEASGQIDLRKLPKIDEPLARKLGALIAEIHDAGIDQPDLFAKHFLIDPESRETTILDWQRATIRKEVSLRSRVRSLAAFRATCSRELLSDSSWERLIEAYTPSLKRKRRTTVSFACASGSGVFLNEIEVEADRLLQRPAIRRHLVPSVKEQELVRIQGETVCAIPEVAEDLRQGEVIDSLYDPTNAGRIYRFRNGRSGALRVSRHRLPFAKIWAMVRGKSWRSNELKLARVLFHLERHGIAAPRLLAYGQRGNGAFCLIDSEPASPIAGAPEQAVAKLHEIGLSVESNAFDCVDGSIQIAEPSRLRLRKRMSKRRHEREIAAVQQLIGAHR